MAKQQKYKHWHLETDADNITWCHLDMQGASANTLSSEVLTEFGGVLDEIEGASPRGVVILSDKANGFIAGANIEEFTTIRDREQALGLIMQGHALFDRLEVLTCPTVGVIHGFCLGGGMELALACRYRVALEGPGTRLGLPEVLLGIHPGFGGSMRMVRQIGVIQGLQLMLTGRSVDARRAGRLGLVDRAVPERHLRDAAVSCITGRASTKRPGFLNRILTLPLVRPLVATFLQRQLQKRISKAHYPAPFALVDLWKEHGGDERAMLDAEAESVADLITTETSRNLVRVFLLQERLKSLGKRGDSRPRHVHVIGAGVMGGDIAAWCALRGLTVTLQDRGPQYIAPAVKRAHQLFKKRLKSERLVRAAMDRLIPDHHGHGLTNAGVIIEAIIEDLDAKVELFKSIEPEIRDDAVLATNTSSIPLAEISGQLVRPERLTGIHFFNPVAKMQLVEIIHGDGTAAEWIEKAASYCRVIDRLPLYVKSSPGFLVNRVLTPYLVEAMVLLEEGHPAVTIDKVARDFGMPMGPVELADSVGLDICLSVAENLHRVLNVPVPEKLREMVKGGQLGRKSGKGFYNYRKGKPVRPKESRRGPADVEDRLVLRILNECAACLREGIVEDADLLDAGMVFGTGFAPFRGGPIHYARQRGVKKVIERLQGLQQQYGDRFTPDEGWNAIS